MIRNIGIIGVGGVGGYFGGKLCRLLDSPCGLNIYFIARGAHLDEIRNKGLYLSIAQEGDFLCTPTLATDNFDDLPVLDVCLLCIKSYDLTGVLDHLRNKIADTTYIIPLLNGIDIYERIKDNMPGAIVFPACVYIGTQIEAQGKVTQKGGACTILFGKDPSYPDLVPAALFDLFEQCTIRYTWYDNVLPEIWKKYIFIAAFGLVSAGYNKTIGEIMESEDLGRHVRSIMKEIVALSEKKGQRLPGTIIEETFRKGLTFPYETKTSFQRDIEDSHKMDERDLFSETILRLSRSYGTDASITRMMHQKIQKLKP